MLCEQRIGRHQAFYPVYFLMSGFYIFLSHGKYMSQIVKVKGIKKGCFTRENLGFNVYLLRDKPQKIFLLYDIDSSDVNNIMCKVINPLGINLIFPY
jgi:hypothetical protein